MAPNRMVTRSSGKKGGKGTAPKKSGKAARGRSDSLVPASGRGAGLRVASSSPVLAPTGSTPDVILVGDGGSSSNAANNGPGAPQIVPTFSAPTNGPVAHQLAPDSAFPSQLPPAPQPQQQGFQSYWPGGFNLGFAPMQQLSGHGGTMGPQGWNYQGVGSPYQGPPQPYNDPSRLGMPGYPFDPRLAVSAGAQPGGQFPAQLPSQAPGLNGPLQPGYPNFSQVPAMYQGTPHYGSGPVVGPSPLNSYQTAGGTRLLACSFRGFG